MIEDILSEKTKLEAFNLLKEGFGDETLRKQFKNFLLFDEKSNLAKDLEYCIKYDGSCCRRCIAF